MNQLGSVEKGAIHHLSTYGLALFLFLTPFEYPLADLMAVSPLRLVGLFAMGLAIVDIWRQRIVKLDYRVIYVVLWLLYGLVSYVWALDRTRFQSYYSIYFNNALMFLLFSMISYTKYEAELLKKAMIFGVGALLLYMLLIPDAVMFSSYQHRLTLKAGKDGLDQNYLAGLMLTSFGIVFYNICNVPLKKRHKNISVIFCAAIAYCVFLTGSRSGLLALLIMALLSINTTWRTRLSIGIPVALLILIVFPLIARYLPESFLERFSLSALTGQEAESGTRLLIWRRAFQSVKGFKWIFGLGTGASQTAVGDVLGRGDSAIHSHYIAMLVEYGLLGSLLLNVPIFKLFLQSKQRKSELFATFCGILMMAAFLDVVTTKFFWASMILWSVCYSANKHRK